MEQRTRDVAEAAGGVHIRTLNSLGLWVLTRHRGRPPALLEERDARRLVESLLPGRRARRANIDPIGPYLEGLASVRLGLRDPDEVEASRDDVPGLAELFPAYRAALAERGAVDFDEQVYGADRGAARRRGVPPRRCSARAGTCSSTSSRTSPRRTCCCSGCSRCPTLDVFGVGDDDQCIYGHAGADPAFLIDYDTLFPGAGQHALHVNYRCPVDVVDGASTLLGYNHRRIPKSIVAGPTNDDAAGHAGGPTSTRRTTAPRALAETVQGWLADPAVEPSSIAVLARVNSLLLAPHVGLHAAGVPIASVLTPDVLDPHRPARRARLPAHRHQPRWVRPSRRRRDPAATDPRPAAVVPGAPRRAAPRGPSAPSPGSPTGWVTRTPPRCSPSPTTCACSSTPAASGDDPRAPRGRPRRRRSRCGDEHARPDRQRAGVEPPRRPRRPARRRRPPPRRRHVRGAGCVAAFQREADPGGVTLSTIHRVKGREWDRVAVFGVSDGIMPHRLAEDVEEERRVLHVAITRGRHRVTVLADRSRRSPFLDELAGRAPHRPAPDRRDVRPQAAGHERAGAASRARRSWPPSSAAPYAAAERALRDWRRMRAPVPTACRPTSCSTTATCAASPSPSRRHPPSSSPATASARPSSRTTATQILAVLASLTS